ncbi:hypothetical protein ACWDCC_42120 [Streptomyces sp. NPDC001102]
MRTGVSSHEGSDDSVWAKLLRRGTDVARLVGAVLQAVYYGLKL